MQSKGMQQQTEQRLNSSGMGLVQALVAVVLVSTFTLGSLSLVSTISVSYGTAQALHEFTDAVAQIESLVSNETSCRLAIGGPTTFGGAPDGAIQTMAAAAATNLRLYSPSVAGGGPGGRQVFMEVDNANANRFGAWTLVALRLRPLSPAFPIAGPNQVTTALELTMRRQGANGLEVERSASTIHFMVDINAARQMVSCFGISYATDATLSAPICPAGEALYSDGTNLGCRRLFCSNPAFPVANGADASGNLICGP